MMRAPSAHALLEQPLGVVLQVMTMSGKRLGSHARSSTAPPGTRSRSTVSCSIFALLLYLLGAAPKQRLTWLAGVWPASQGPGCDHAPQLPPGTQFSDHAEAASTCWSILHRVSVAGARMVQ